jgi:hypothetical protein
MRHTTGPGHGEGGHAGEPVVGMEDVEVSQVRQALAELRDVLLVIAFGQRMRGAGIHKTQAEAIPERHNGRVGRRRSPRDDVDLVPERGQGLRLVQHDHVHAAGIAGARLVGR